MRREAADHRGRLLSPRQAGADEEVADEGRRRKRPAWSTCWWCAGWAARCPGQPGRDLWWDELVRAQSAECATGETDAEDPYMIIYTSGTTGRPKGVVHVQCGFPIKAAQDLAHCFDLHAGDVLFWISRYRLDDGAVGHRRAADAGRDLLPVRRVDRLPAAGPVWALVERHRVTHLGISPTAVRSLMGQGDDWGRQARPEQPAVPRRARASRGTPSPGAGCSTWWAGARARSSTTRAAPRVSGGILCLQPSAAAQSPAPSARPCPAWPPMWWTTEASRCAARWANW